MFICTHILAQKNAHRQQFKSSCSRQRDNVLYIDCARTEAKPNLGTGDGEKKIKDSGSQEIGVTLSLDIHPMHVSRSFHLLSLCLHHRPELQVKAKLKCQVLILLFSLQFLEKIAIALK